MIHFPNLKDFNQKKEKLCKGGINKIQIISDFDRTLTPVYYDDQFTKCPSTHGILEHSEFLSPEYRAASRQLYLKYFPLEFSHDIPISQKTILMVEWWDQAHKNLIKDGLKKDDLKTIVRSAKICFRSRAKELFDLLESHNVPLLIFSAGITDILKEVLIQHHDDRMHSNIEVLSNEPIWDDQNQLIAFRDPVIHSFNKSEHSFKHQQFVKYDDRTNIILLGDSIGDVNMIDGIFYENCIKVGFLNPDNEESTKVFNEYKKIYDVIIMNDGPMDFILQLVQDILANEKCT